MLREIVLAYSFGRSYITDAFVNAYGIPNIILSFIVGATASSYIPVYNTVPDKNKFSDNLLTLFAVIGIALSVSVIVFPQPFLKLVAWTASSDVYSLSLTLMRYMAFAMLPMLIASILSAQLQVKSKFFIATVYQIFNNIFIVAAIFIAKATNFLPLIGIGVVFGNVLSTSVLVVADRGDLRQYKPNMSLSDPSIRRFFILLAPIILSTLVSQINTIITQNFANSLDNHAVSTLNYANKVQGVFTAFIGMAVATAFFPEMAKTAGEGNIVGLKNQISSALKCLLPILIPLTIGLLLLSEPIIRILLERGEFSHEDTQLTATALKYVVFAMFAANINQMLSRGFYAMQKTKLPAIISAICVLINIFCVFAFIGPMHYKGLALATSISGMVGMLANYIFLRRELKSLQVYSTPEWIKLLASVAVMSIIIILGKSFLPLMNDSYLLCIISLVGLVGVSVLVYAGLLVILKTEISTMIINIFVNRKNTTTSEVPI